MHVNAVCGKTVHAPCMQLYTKYPDPLPGLFCIGSLGYAMCMNLSVENLACGRADRIAAHGISFDVAAGKGLVLRGPNGAGKTTLLRTLAGLTPVRAGMFSADADLAFFGHLDAVKPQLTVDENLAFWASVAGHGAASGAIGRARALFGLGELANRPAAQLSAGQRRRLGLSRLALVEGAIWLLDEPTVSLDTANAARVETVVAEHLARGGIAVVAMHQPFAVEGMADYDLGAKGLSADHDAGLHGDSDDAFLAGFGA